MKNPVSISEAVREYAEDTGIGGPLIVVFSNSGFLPILENWLAAIKRVRLTNYVVVALDDDIYREMSRRALPSVRIDYGGTFGDLMVRRFEVFRQLCHDGIDFIHSDADAVWFGDPVREYFSDPAVDLTFSQGICHPRDVYEDWGFVLCCGLFGAKASRRTVDFFDRVLSAIPEGGDDQATVNRLLLNDGMTWHIDPASSYTATAGTGDEVLCADVAFNGTARQSGLTISVLPHRQFQRLGMSPDGTYVRHVYASKEIPRKIERLKQRGCWVLDEKEPMFRRFRRFVQDKLTSSGGHPTSGSRR